MDIVFGVLFEGGVGGGFVMQCVVFVQVWCGWWGDVVEEVVVFVEYYQQCGFVLDFWVGGQCVEYLGSVFGFLDWVGWVGVFGVFGWGDDLGYLWQVIGQYVVFQCIEFLGVQVVDDQW